MLWLKRELGLPNNATRAQVRRRYLDLCKQLHPDKTNDANKHARYVRVKEAYAQLMRHMPAVGDDGVERGKREPFTGQLVKKNADNARKEANLYTQTMVESEEEKREAEMMRWRVAVAASMTAFGLYYYAFRERVS